MGDVGAEGRCVALLCLGDPGDAGCCLGRPTFARSASNDRSSVTRLCAAVFSRDSSSASLPSPIVALTAGGRLLSTTPEEAGNAVSAAPSDVSRCRQPCSMRAPTWGETVASGFFGSSAEALPRPKMPRLAAPIMPKTPSVLRWRCISHTHRNCCAVPRHDACGANG